MTRAKRKTAKPAHVKPLTSSRWSGVRLSKTTEKKINDAYAKRKMAKRSARKPVKVKEPRLSEKTTQKLNMAYNRRKTQPRRDKREAKREAFKKANSKFVVGETYETFYIVDHTSKIRFTVIARTPQFVTLHYIGQGRKDRKCKVNVDDGVEYCYPEGRYSMCPVLEATDRVSRAKVPEGTRVTAKLPGLR